MQIQIDRKLLLLIIVIIIIIVKVTESAYGSVGQAAACNASISYETDSRSSCTTYDLVSC